LIESNLKRLKDKSDMMQRVIQTDDVLEIGVQLVKRGNKKRIFGLLGYIKLLNVILAFSANSLYQY
jgi:hypothetical protein